MCHLKPGLWEFSFSDYKIDEGSDCLISPPTFPQGRPGACSGLQHQGVLPGDWHAAAAVTAEKARSHLGGRAAARVLGHTSMSQITTELLFTGREDVFPNKAQVATGTVFLPSLLIKCFFHSSKSFSSINSSIKAFLGLSSGLPSPLISDPVFVTEVCTCFFFFNAIQFYLFIFISRLALVSLPNLVI